jgi:hypothetical protein
MWNLRSAVGVGGVGDCCAGASFGFVRRRKMKSGLLLSFLIVRSERSTTSASTGSSVRFLLTRTTCGGFEDMLAREGCCVVDLEAV